MTTHLSVMLAWHDRAWDGHICDQPHLNAHCIVHQHIRDSRDDEKERGTAGKPLAELEGWLPPCSRDQGAYAERGFLITHQDPLEFRRLLAVSEDIPPYLSCPAPYRWMREEFVQEVCEAEDISLRGPDNPRSSGWVFEPDRQRELLKRFWGKLEPKNSLVFYYCNHGIPLDENSPRIIVGIGRIAEVGPQIYFGTTPKYQDQYPVWSRRITQAYPEQGFVSRTKNACGMVKALTISSAEFHGSHCFHSHMEGNMFLTTSRLPSLSALYNVWSSLRLMGTSLLTGKDASIG